MSMSRKDFEAANKALADGFNRLATLTDDQMALEQWQMSYLQAEENLANMFEQTYSNFNREIWDKRFAAATQGTWVVSIA